LKKKSLFVGLKWLNAKTNRLGLNRAQ
jgi:hypothetical protein